MTTTLRPLAPEERTPGGGRSRRYAVCVNSRRVGELLVTAPGDLGGAVGEISRLRIDDADRGRGRATVACLAAEEVLRGWGCRTVRASADAGFGPGIRLAAALGYTERNRNMVKELDDAPPPLPEGYTAEPLTGTRFREWQDREVAQYAASLVESGLPEGVARSKSAADHARYLPDGAATGNAVLRVLHHRGTEVGMVWVGLDGPAGAAPPWVLNVEVAEEHRGRGHGRTLMRLAEAECRAAGRRTLGLNVFTHNTPAMRLYESLGYTTVSHHFAKALL